VDLPADERRDPLTAPTTSRVFAAIADARRPLPTAAVAERTGVHPNSARFHLARLLEAGLLELGADRSGGRGRPRRLWSVASDASPGGKAPEAYRELASFLSRSVGGSADARAEGRRIGAEIGAGSGVDNGTPEALGSALSAMGFQPRRHDAGNRTEFTLCNCPYRDVAGSNPGIVCALHRGVAEGLVKAIDPAAEVTRFVPEDPSLAGCIVEIASSAEQTSTEVPDE
jgi:predicted ArsR family transcriptional regulator